MKTCSVASCKRITKNLSQEWCEMHWMRWRRTGDPTKLKTDITAPKPCINCGKLFRPKRMTSATACSSKCNVARWRDNNPEHYHYIRETWKRKNGVLKSGSPELRKVISERLSGITLPEKTKELMRGAAHRGVDHFAWKGDKVSYRALHKWVERYLGKPGICSGCGANGLSGRAIHWSNVSGEYHRDLSDWQRLCAKCHKAYDIALRERVAS